MGESELNRHLRNRLSLLSAIADVSAALVAYWIALVVWDVYRGQPITPWTASPDWSVPLVLFVTLSCFLAVGLYKLEVYVSRPLHAATLIKGTLVVLVLTAFLSFALKAPVVTESRLTLFVACLIFFTLSFTLRMFVLDRVYRADVARRGGVTLLIGAASECEELQLALRDLRGFSLMRSAVPLDPHRNGNPPEPQLVSALRDADPAPRQVFIDPASVGHRATLDLITLARSRGAAVYVVGRLVGPLDTTRLLLHLFGLPVMRVRHDAAVGEPAGLKRAFDVGVSAVALVALSPVLALIAAAIKIDSRGPVLFRQQRIGARGRPFDFLKFRTMETGNDPAAHRDYVCRLIDGEEVACVDERGEAVLKLAADPRVTGVGRVLRKYSLDELPQLWNVLRGDMSIVGPRPALGYEVAAYKDWHRRRLDAMPGLSGLWQVAGRSRVTFDEMVFQDVVYTCNQSLLTDLTICLRTVPVVLTGRGAL